MFMICNTVLSLLEGVNLKSLNFSQKKRNALFWRRNNIVLLYFSFPPNKLDYRAFLAPFETIHKKLIKEDLFEKSGYFPASVKAKLKDIAYSGCRSYSRPDFLFSKEDIKLLDHLKNDNNIVIVKPDKGNGVVILDRNDYNKKMNDILQDNTRL